MKIRNGLTLVELLVVIAIVGLLVGLLLPAVQSARESVRRVRCGANFKQTATALQAFHEANGSLPAGKGNRRRRLAGGGTWFAETDNDTARPDTWAAMILPYLEQSVIFDKIDFTRVPGDAVHRDTLLIPVPVMICTSDPQSATPVLNDRCAENGRGTSVMLGSWIAASLGPMAFWGDSSSCRFCKIAIPSASNPCCFRSKSSVSVGSAGARSSVVLGNYGSGPGVFSVSRLRVSFADVMDGLSNTSLIGEFLPSETMHTAFYMDNNNAGAFNIPVNTFSFAADLPPAPPGHYSHRGADKRNSGIKSRHPGGAHVGFCDGSVRFLDETMAVDVLAAIGSRKLSAIGLEAVQ